MRRFWGWFALGAVHGGTTVIIAALFGPLPAIVALCTGGIVIVFLLAAEQDARR